MKLRVLPRLAVVAVVALGCLAGLMAPAASADTIPGNTVFTPVPAHWYGNGCGFVPERLPDRHVLPDPLLPIWLFPVDFRNPCNVHDAGYAGGIVSDPATGVTIDTTRLTRLQIDNRFLSDLLTACNQQIPLPFVVARTSCHAIASSYYAFVRSPIGNLRFDASPAVPGIQFTGARLNN